METESEDIVENDAKVKEEKAEIEIHCEEEIVKEKDISASANQIKSLTENFLILHLRAPPRYKQI